MVKPLAFRDFVIRYCEKAGLEVDTESLDEALAECENYYTDGFDMTRKGSRPLPPKGKRPSAPKAPPRPLK